MLHPSSSSHNLAPTVFFFFFSFLQKKVSQNKDVVAAAAAAATAAWLTRIRTVCPAVWAALSHRLSSGTIGADESPLSFWVCYSCGGEWQAFSDGSPLSSLQGTHCVFHFETCARIKKWNFIGLCLERHQLIQICPDPTCITIQIHLIDSWYCDFIWFPPFCVMSLPYSSNVSFENTSFF